MTPVGAAAESEAAEAGHTPCVAGRVRNWFAEPWVAARYAAGRPDVHGAIAARIREAGNVERGTLTLAEAAARLDAGLAPFFAGPDERRPMRFVSPLHLTRRHT
jgi:hypothetical protein